MSRGAGKKSLHDVLRVGTIFGATSIGLDKDLGSIEAGKLAVRHACKLGRGRSDHRACHAAVLRAASCRTFAQNKA